MPAPQKPKPDDARIAAVIERLKSEATTKDLEGMARYAIPSDKAFGVAMNKIQKLAKEIGKDHELAAALWESGWYEARILAGYVDEPARVTPAQMDRWCREFDNWAICDSICFALFKRVPFAWDKVRAWATRKDEFGKRGAFALIWALAGSADEDEPFYEALPLIEAAATDERNFVKKSVDMALRAIGKRSLALNKAAVATAKKLVKSADATAMWIGKHALKELESESVRKRLGD
ncbi:DNA alkylation repair protein [Luteolibacter sp. GHJ8]|uniref:DNA alkylation repair protein n=1 Tax=Luteolibacter rhizosphaerae TaxID=2989719 RepID=A0ABT3G389_9BACT|nr:DNA alkylation repair protein [Luteolibacter rhizosphaerae]MCW1914317.1 DNA alkylation repair protein [Luteolibacter rhizosphaerae]